MQIFAVRRDRFEKDAVMYALAFCEDIVYRKGREHPVLDGVLFQYICISDVVLISICPVALNIDSEDLLYGILVAIECTSGHRDSFAHISAKPLPVQVFQGNPSELVDGVYQPYVLSEDYVRSHFANIL